MVQWLKRVALSIGKVRVLAPVVQRVDSARHQLDKLLFKPAKDSAEH